MAGAGNDFLVLDVKDLIKVGTHRDAPLQKLTVKICDRANGVGADGLVILDKSKSSDYKMRIINADGSEAEMCGNGVRCLAAYIVATQKPKKKLFSIETLAGEILGEAKGEVAHVRLSNPKDYRAEITVPVNGRDLHVSYIDTGVPHTIIFVDDLANIDVSNLGQIIRYHDVFKPRGTNVNFVEQIDATLVAARTYERGVEDETKACGTGSVAAAIVSYLKANPHVKQKESARMKVRTTGGEILEVTFDVDHDKISNVWLKGSAKFIAKGEYYL